MTKIKEIWKDIAGYEGYYQASNLGHIRSLSRSFNYNRTTCGTTPQTIFNNRRGAIIKQSYNHKGYLGFDLNKGGNRWHVISHRIIARTFIPNPENKPEVNHKNGIKDDNRVINLEWVTTSENARHSFDVLKRKARNGERINTAKLTEPQIITIRIWASFKPITEIARYFGVQRYAIDRIIKRKSWKHVKESNIQSLQ